MVKHLKETKGKLFSNIFVAILHATFIEDVISVSEFTTMAECKSLVTLKDSIGKL